MESKKPLSLLLVGKIGTGKSSTGNSILQRSSFVSKRSCKGVTVAGQLETSSWDGRSISVIDTPGMCDGTLTLDDLRNAFRVSLQLSPSGVSAILLVLSVNTRISDEEIQVFQELGTIFGRDWARWLVVVWTHVDQLKEDGTTLEEFLEGSPKQLLQLMTAAGGRSVAFDNRAVDSAVKLKQITLLLAEADKVLRNNDNELYTSEKFDAATLAANPPLRGKKARRLRQQEVMRKRHEQLQKERSEAGSSVLWNLPLVGWLVSLFSSDEVASPSPSSTLSPTVVADCV